MNRRTAFLIILSCYWCGPTLLAGSVSLQPCESRGLPDDAQCGKYRVHENRAARSGRSIDLNVVVLPAQSESKQPDPLFALAGGPGQAASHLAPIFVGMKGIRRDRDIVLVDQRGTGGSNGLACLPEDRSEAIESILSFRFEDLEECRSQAEADLTLYTTDIAMDDLDELRQALGYEKINLWGGSYGSRAALVYLRRHPERVRTVVLRGVAPPPLLVPLSFGKGAQKALDAVFTACRQDSDCNAAFPGLRKEWKNLQRQVRESPTHVSVRVPRGEAELGVNHDTLVNSVLFMLYDSASARLIPSFIASASKGDWKPLMGFGAGFSAVLSTQLSLGMTLSVLCAEDVAFFEKEAVEQSVRGTFLGSALVDNLVDACQQWPVGEVSEGYHEHVRSDVPVLMLSGEFDPVTPPGWAEAAASYLPNSLHIVMPNTGHVPAHPGCSRDLFVRFIRQGSVEGLDASCVQGMKRPAFQTRG